MNIMIHIRRIVVLVFFIVWGSSTVQAKNHLTFSFSAFYSHFSAKKDTGAPESFTEKFRKTLGMEAIEKKTKEYFKYALTFDLPVENIGNMSLFNFISEWYGTRYIFGGSTKKGIDCSAFTQRFYKNVYNMQIPRTCEYQYKYSNRISILDIQMGDILFFNSKVSPSGWHCGIYIGNDLFVHAANWRDGVKISCLQDEHYQRIYKGAGRFN